MHDLLSVDQVAGLLDLVQHVTHIIVPLIQLLIGRLLDGSAGSLLEHNNALHSVNLGLNARLFNYHVAQLTLSQVHTHS